jgi:2-polyprenyl-3-methyl-5-hydroxy-6-metoxy-1,4-benzoquinol methylase
VLLKSKEEILEINQRQKAFYNYKKKNLISRLWSHLREGGLKQLRRDLGILNQCYALHKDWLGNLSDKKVLDLGCYEGNSLSVYLAENSKNYIGIDLSETGIDVLQKKIKHISKARAMAVDFLSDDFTEDEFDIIYAYGVLHHFENVPILVKTLNQKLAKHGKIIGYDPMKTSFPIWLARTLYRPFQSDASWEFPFGRKTLSIFEENFNILEARGVLGWSKYYLLLSWWPWQKESLKKLATKAHNYDWQKSSKNKSHLYRCMQLNLLLEKK